MIWRSLRRTFLPAWVRSSGSFPDSALCLLWFISHDERLKKGICCSWHTIWDSVIYLITINWSLFFPFH